MGKIRKNGYKILAQIIPFSDGNCPLCGEPIDLEGIKRYVHWMEGGHKSFPRVRRKFIDVDIDHIQPIEFGGGNEISNLQLTHPKCNSSKSNRLGITRWK